MHSFTLVCYYNGVLEKQLHKSVRVNIFIYRKVREEWALGRPYAYIVLIGLVHHWVFPILEFIAS